MPVFTLNLHAIGVGMLTCLLYPVLSPFHFHIPYCTFGFTKFLKLHGNYKTEPIMKFINRLDVIAISILFTQKLQQTNYQAPMLWLRMVHSKRNHLATKNKLLFLPHWLPFKCLIVSGPQKTFHVLRRCRVEFGKQYLKWGVPFWLLFKKCLTQAPKWQLFSGSP